MMLGENSKHDLQAFGKIVVQLQTKALAAVTGYFAIPEPDIALADARQSFVRIVTLFMWREQVHSLSPE